MKEKYIELINKGLTTYQIATELNSNQSSICCQLKKFGLKTNTAHGRHREKIKMEIASGNKTCCNCKILMSLDNFHTYKNGKIHAICKKCNNDNGVKKLQNFKLKCIKYKGGKCKICDYNKNQSAMDFHHVDQKTKLYEISDYRGSNFEKVKTELDKCVLVCKNCHSEMHNPELTLN